MMSSLAWLFWTLIAAILISPAFVRIPVFCETIIKLAVYFVPGRRTRADHLKEQLGDFDIIISEKSELEQLIFTAWALYGSIRLGITLRREGVSDQKEQLAYLQAVRDQSTLQLMETTLAHLEAERESLYNKHLPTDTLDQEITRARAELRKRKVQQRGA